MPDDRRRRELAKIHILAKKDLGMDDETYRDMLEAVTGQRSAGRLDDAGREAVIAHLARQLAGKVMRTGTGYPGRPKNWDSEMAPREMRKVEALLAEAHLPWTYVMGIAQRMFADCPARLEWFTSEHWRPIVAALMRDAKRHGRRTE